MYMKIEYREILKKYHHAAKGLLHIKQSKSLINILNNPIYTFETSRIEKAPAHSTSELRPFLKSETCYR